MLQTQKCVCHMPEAWSVEYIKSQWIELEKSCEISFFQSWYWIDSWLTIAKKHIRPVIFKYDGRIVGLAFLGTGRTYEHRYIGFSTLIPWGTGIADIDVCASEYNTPIILPGYETLVRQSLVQFLMTDKRLTKTLRIDFRAVPEQDLGDYKIDGYHYDIYKTQNGAIVPLEKIRTDDMGIQSIISKNTLSQIKKSISLYTENFGEVIYEVAENATKAQNWFVELGKLNQQRFRTKKQKGVWDYPNLVQMHRALLDRFFEKGCAEIVRVRAGDKVIGYLYNFIYRNHVYFYMGGFVYELDNKYRPGMMTHYYAILSHVKTPHQFYDFMAGDQSYKQRLGQESTNMISFTITKPCFKYKISYIIAHIRKIIRL